MKKISLILFGVFGLLFTTNVKADLLPNPGTFYRIPFDYYNIESSQYYNDNDKTEVNWEYIHVDKNEFTYYTHETGFGRYSNGTIIPHYRVANINNNSLAFPQWTKHYNGTNVDPNTGEVLGYVDLGNARKINFSAPTLVCTSTGQCPETLGQDVFRIDFTVRFDFYYQDGNSIYPLYSDDRKTIFSGLWVDYAKSNGVTCFSNYNASIYTVDISCTGSTVSSFEWSLEFRNIKDSSAFHSYNYHYFMEMSFSEATLVIKSSGRLEDLVTPMSPSGETFTDYYRKVEVQSNSYFDKFSDFDFNGLSNVILAPIQFIRSLSSSYLDDEYTQSNKYTCNIDPLKLSMNIFGHNICIPSGHIFWNRGRDLFNISKARMLSNFRNTWNVLLGGLIIYLLCVKLFKVCINALDPHKEDIESL